MRKIFLAVALISVFGCISNEKTYDIESKVLYPLKKFEQINDSTFLSLVMNMTENKGFVYFSDLKNGRIVLIDSNYKFVSCFGSPGRGPSEFSLPGPGGATVNNNRLYAIDEENKRINIYDLIGNFVGDIKGYIPERGRFIINDSVYFGSTSTNDKPPIFKAHISGKLIKRFGNNQRVLNDVNKNMSKNYFLETWKDQIIAICDSDPVIEKYSYNGEFLNSFNYSTLNYVTTYITYVEEKQKKDRKSGLRGLSMFCMNSYIKEDRLYLLISGYSNQKHTLECNHILVLDVGNEKITPLAMLELRNEDGKDSWYYSFCVADGKIIAYDCLPYEIQEFNIK